MLSGCGTPFDLTRKQADDNLLLDGAGGDISPKVAQAYADNQDKYLKIFAHIGGVKGAAGNEPNLENLSSDDWKLVTNGGVIYVTGQCEDYLHAIWELNRARQATNNEIGYANSLVMAVMGALKASSASLAITGSAFGFASSTSENLYSSVLYQLEPSSVNSLVHNGEDAVKQSIASTMAASPPSMAAPAGAAAPAESGASKTTPYGRNEAVSAIRLYLSVCMPHNIEAMVNIAVKNSTTTVQKAGGASTTPPAPGAAADHASQNSGGSATTGSAGPLGATSVTVNPTTTVVTPPAPAPAPK